jgi:hypothetical protein
MLNTWSDEAPSQYTSAGFVIFQNDRDTSQP